VVFATKYLLDPPFPRPSAVVDILRFSPEPEWRGRSQRRPRLREIADEGTIDLDLVKRKLRRLPSDEYPVPKSSMAMRTLKGGVGAASCASYRCSGIRAGFGHLEFQPVCRQIGRCQRVDAERQRQQTETDWRRHSATLMAWPTIASLHARLSAQSPIGLISPSPRRPWYEVDGGTLRARRFQRSASPRMSWSRGVDDRLVMEFESLLAIAARKSFLQAPRCCFMRAFIRPRKTTQLDGPSPLARAP